MSNCWSVEFGTVVHFSCKCKCRGVVVGRREWAHGAREYGVQALTADGVIDEGHALHWMPEAIIAKGARNGDFSHVTRPH